MSDKKEAKRMLITFPRQKKTKILLFNLPFKVQAEIQVQKDIS